MQNNSLYRSRRTALTIGYAVFALVASAWMARSDSLFPIKAASKSQTGSNSASAASLFSDTRAHDVGDIVLITITESTSAQSSANTKTSHDDSVNVFGGAGLFQRLFKELTLSASNSRAGNGTGQTTRSGSLVTSLSVMVKEVLPNGTLKLEGSRLITINRETQRVTFTGIVRPEDIGQDNSVPSTLIAQVEVRYDGKGIVGETQRQGILSRIFKFLF